MSSDLTAYETTIADLTARLAEVRGLVADFQEETDRAGMFQHISPEWKRQYLDALHRLAGVRTRQRELECNLDVANRHRAGLAEILRHNAQLAKAVAR